MPLIAQTSFPLMISTYSIKKKKSTFIYGKITIGRTDLKNKKSGIINQSRKSEVKTAILNLKKKKSVATTCNSLLHPLQHQKKTKKTRASCRPK